MNDRCLKWPALLFSYGIVIVIVFGSAGLLLDFDWLVQISYLPVGTGLVWLFLSLIYRQIFPFEPDRTQDSKR